jgi:hypothetical protein
MKLGPVSNNTEQIISQFCLQDDRFAASQTSQYFFIHTGHVQNINCITFEAYH